MDFKDKVGVFRVITSFTIRRKKEFYLIGELLEGSLQDGNYINIILNSTLALSAKISSIEDVEFINDFKIYKLLTIESDEYKLNDILFAQNVENETVFITLNDEIN